MEQAAQLLKQPGPAAIAATLFANRLAFLHAFRRAGGFTFLGAGRLAGCFATIAMLKQSAQPIQESVATAATATPAATRSRGGRRVRRSRRSRRLIGACEPGRRYQQESSIHRKLLCLWT